MGNSSSATLKGEFVYEYPQKITFSYQDEKIINIEIWGCRLLHGSYNWLATGAANTLSLGSSDPIQHWWLVIQTDYAYYTIQKWSDGRVTMRRTKSLWQANQNGLCCADKNESADRWRKKSCRITKSYKTMKWFTQTLSSMKIGPYNFLACNCQDFAVRAFKTIESGVICNQTRVGNYPWLHPGVGIGYLITGGNLQGLSKKL